MISVVIPLFDEAENLVILYKRLLIVFREEKLSFEIVFVDDGSTDESLSILKKLESKDTHVRVYSFRRNQGKAEALTLGFAQAKGDYIITMDADLQDRPEEIHKLFEKAKDGFD